MRPIQIWHPLDQSGRRFVEFNIKEGEEVSGDRLLEEGKVPVDLFFYKKIATVRAGPEGGSRTRSWRWNSSHGQVDAKILLAGDEQKAGQEFWWWIVYSPVTCRAQVMQSISVVALSVVGERGIRSVLVEVHIQEARMEEEEEEEKGVKRSGSCGWTCWEKLPTDGEGNRSYFSSDSKRPEVEDQSLSPTSTHLRDNFHLHQH